MRPIDLMNAMNDLPEDYIARELEYQPKKRSIPIRAVIAAAACLLVTLGLAQGFWSRRPRIDTLPPQEMLRTTETLPTSETLPTEPITNNTTAASTSGSIPDTTAVESAAETIFTTAIMDSQTTAETVTLPAQSIPAPTQPSSSAVQDTRPATTVFPAATAQTDPTEVPTETNDTAAEIEETVPATTFPADPTEDSNVAETIVSPTDPMMVTDPPEPTDPTEPYALPVNLTADTSGRDALDGFQTEERFGRTVLTVNPETAESEDPTDFILDYTCTDRRYFQEGTTTDVDNGIWFLGYSYFDMQTGEQFQVRLYCRGQFRLEYQSDGAQFWRLDRPEGCIFLHTNMGNYLLYDDGNYVMLMEYTNPQIDYQGFLEHFVPRV